jgi:hypothetical protein
VTRGDGGSHLIEAGSGAGECRSFAIHPQAGGAQRGRRSSRLLEEISGDVVSAVGHSRDPAQPLGGAAPG